MTNYDQLLDWLFARTAMFQRVGADAYKPGLGTTLALASAWGNPQKKFKSVHIAGTNGKGSTAHSLAAICQAAGYKTGLYTSPHLVDFRERMRVNGRMIDRQFIIDFLHRFQTDEVLQALNPSFFELTTIMAFAWFAQERVDIAIIETGLGGRLDSTNIITPLCSVITNIAFDHTALLGDTLEQIAREKAGIIKHGVPVVVGRAEGIVREVFLKKAEEESAPIVFASEIKPYNSYEREDDFIVYSTDKGIVKADLCGECQPENAATILCAADILSADLPNISFEAIQKGMSQVVASTGLMGRWMTVERKPMRVVCDTAHNADGWRTIAPSLRRLAESGRLHMVLGFVNDKDIQAIVPYMPADAEYYFVCPSVERGRAAESSAAICADYGIKGHVCGTVAQGIAEAKNAATEGDSIFIGGSNFTVADALTVL